jgi:hypothetical protein
MKVNGSGGVRSTAAGSGARSTAASGFSVAQAGPAAETARTARAAAAGAVGSVDALLALQEAEGPMERRRRAVRRAGRVLDVLDEVKLAMLGGQSSGPALERLARAVREARDGTGDEKLEGVLDEVETRAAVELAKAEMARVAA